MGLKPEFTKDYARFRVKDPNDFKQRAVKGEKGKFRTLDVGRKNHSKILRGRLKNNGRWATQAVLVTRKDYRQGTRVKVKKGRVTIVKKHKRVLKTKRRR